MGFGRPVVHQGYILDSQSSFRHLEVTDRFSAFIFSDSCLADISEDSNLSWSQGLIGPLIAVLVTTRSYLL